ncbi:DUF3368 domain-containing protein [bacterium]|nr:DUF3368 domain-containing protein [bacterium]
MIPSSVHAEVIGQAQARPGLELREAAWLQVMPDPASIDQLKAFGAGERSAIALAQTLSAKLIIDDQKARTAAEQLGVSCAGTLNVIGQAKSLGLITQVKPILDELIGNSFRISPKVVAKILSSFGE